MPTSDSGTPDKAASVSLPESADASGRTQDRPRTLRVRLDKKIGDHYHVTLFAGGAGCGKLCLRKDEVAELVAAHGWSADNEAPEFEEIARAVGLGETCVREEPRAPHCKTCVCGKRAPVQGDSTFGVGGFYREEAIKELGREPRGPGTISWEEHERAWCDYARRYGRQQSAERLAERGGFGYGELIDHLGREPETWRPAGREEGPTRG